MFSCYTPIQGSTPAHQARSPINGRPDDTGRRLAGRGCREGPGMRTNRSSRCGPTEEVHCLLTKAEQSLGLGDRVSL